MNLQLQHHATGDRDAQTGQLRSLEQRTRLLEAVIEVALERGCAHVTLDAVAHQAGISKGGLLYHFRSKVELIRAVLCHYDDGWLAQQLEGRATPGETGPIDPLAIAMLVAVAEAPSLLEGGDATAEPWTGSGKHPRAAYALLARRLAMSRTASSTDMGDSPDCR